MDTNLFSKIKNLIDEKTKEKVELIKYIQEKTEIKIKENQLEIKGKKVFLYLNSNQKIIFIKQKGEEIIKEKGYSI